MTTPSNLILTNLGNGIRLNWSCPDAHETEIYISVDNGVYNLLNTVTGGVGSYDDIGDYINHTIKYRIRAKGAVISSGFSNIVDDILEFVFTSTGDGSGLGVFNLMPSVGTIMTIDGTGKFYDDINGTTNERSSQVLTANVLNRVFIKVPSGIAILRVKNVIIKWGDDWTGSNLLDDGWDTYVYGDGSSVNCPSVSIDVARMTHNTSINVFGLNTIYGDLSGNSIMTYMEIADGTPAHTTPGNGGATCGGDVSLMPLKTFDVWDDTHFTGTCESADMEVIWCNGLNEVVFNITVMPLLKTIIIYAQSSCSVIGDISLCPDITFVQVYVTNTISGSIAGLTALEYIEIISGNTITVPNVTNVSKLGVLDIAGLVLTSANVNQILADVWANRDVARVYSSRLLRLNKTGSEAPTGQGLTDLANLRAYRSPNNDPTKDLWTIAVIS